jgi:hypothetical protein
MRAALWCVAAAGALIAVVAALAFGMRALVGVAIGSALATANLWLVARIVRAFLLPSERRLSWGIVTVLKFSGLFAAVYLLYRSGWVDMLALAAGYGSLPLGIVAAQARTVDVARQKG